jgi:3-deoxy-D-manno-octulosonic-acid transferase
MHRLILFLYNIIFAIILPFLFFILLIKGIRKRDYLRRWNERVSLIPTLPKRKRIWIHALSLGEVNASVPLIKKIKEIFINYSILVTTTTPTGSSQLKKLFGDSIEHFYLPYDFSYFIKNFLKKSNPDLCIIIETEIWPNLIIATSNNNIPIFLVNGRLSEKSKNRYFKIKSFISYLLNRFTSICVRDFSDAERFKILDVDEKKLFVTGNIKFDIKVDNFIYERAERLRDHFSGKIVFTAGSTHDGEESIILEAYFKLLKKIENMILIIAPRDPLRSKDIANLVENYKFEYIFRSELNNLNKKSFNVLIIDTIGELLIFYALGDLAFVGGSMVTKGGHNPLEPIGLKVPTLSGEYTFNFSDLYKTLSQGGIVNIVKNSDDIVEAAYKILYDNNYRKDIIDKGILFIENNKGAVDKVINILSKHVNNNLTRS